MNATRLTESLALPDESTRLLTESLTEEHAHQTLAAFLKLHETRIARRSPSLVELLRSEHGRGIAFEAAWHPAFGRLSSALRSDAQGVTERAAAVGTVFHHVRARSDWEVTFPTPTGFLFDRWSIADVRSIHASDDEITFRTTEERSVAFLAMNGWIKTLGPATELPEVRGGRAPWIVIGAEQMQTPEMRDIAVKLDPREPETMASHCARARDHLVPEYAPWVDSVVRFIAPWVPESDERPSGSSSSSLAPGVVALGHHGHHLALADSLVHEASHLYFYLALRLGPVTDGSDTAHYFNPFLEIDRPIDRILLAYHAFANVLLFHRALAEAGRDESFVRERTSVLVGRVRVLQDALDMTGSLTATGQALYEPLRGQLGI